METSHTRGIRSVAAPAAARTLAARTAVAALAVLLSLAGCARLRESAAVAPMRQAPPSASGTYEAPGPVESYRAAPDAWRLEATVVPEPGKVHALPELIDLALRAHPTTRRAWEQARSAAAALGRSDAAYYPQLATGAGVSRYKGWSPTPPGTESKHVTEGGPALELTWMLLDFGRRSAERERARQQLFAASFEFNRSLQDVVYEVQRSFYVLDAKRARVAAAEADLEAATTVARSAESRLAAGLATRPDVLLTLQEQASSAYTLEDARGQAAAGQADLAQAVGVPADRPLEIESLDQLPLPDALATSVEELIDGALARRPDLAAELARLRAHEAELARERARFLPTLSFQGEAAQVGLRYSVGAPTTAYASHTDDRLLYGAYLKIEWAIFEGFDRVNAVREKQADVEAARAALAERELEAIADVWKAYADVKSARRKLEFGEALLAASQEAYDATLDSYRVGLNTVTNLIVAYRDLSRARATLIEARAQLLVTSATLAHAGGAMSVGAVGP